MMSCSLLAVMAEAEAVVDIARFAWLFRFGAAGDEHREEPDRSNAPGRPCAGASHQRANQTRAKAASEKSACMTLPRLGCPCAKPDAPQYQGPRPARWRGQRQTRSIRPRSSACRHFSIYRAGSVLPCRRPVAQRSLSSNPNLVHHRNSVYQSDLR